jgi:DNA mismatch endonuclease (patch repair protein)
MPRNSVTSDSERRPFKAVEKRLSGRHRLLTTPVTSERMSKIRQKGTAPEIVVRRALSLLGFRYTLDNRDLPGSPDLANRSKKWAVFVHGCYWHHHDECPRATTPRSNSKFWLAKFAANKRRDAEVVRALESMGFAVFKIWECECVSSQSVQDALSQSACGRRQLTATRNTRQRLGGATPVRPSRSTISRLASNLSSQSTR